ncbi:MAG TPA: hypothetical protein VFD41_09300 [Actinomycetales bacterium]|nr:hypothetical protein [Actinomycetales bacterium]
MSDSTVQDVDARVGMLVGVPDGTPPDRLDDVLPIIDDVTEELADRLTEQGSEVTQVVVARGGIPLTDEDEGTP